eukprot:19256-Eustigmatos_ZCMA.PRE.1
MSAPAPRDAPSRRRVCEWYRMWLLSVGSVIGAKARNNVYPIAMYGYIQRLRCEMKITSHWRRRTHML